MQPLANVRAWDKHAIKAEVNRLGFKWTDLARAYGVPPGKFQGTVSGKHRSSVADQIIAEVLGRPLHELWPDRYSSTGFVLKKLRPKPPMPDDIRRRLEAARSRREPVTA